MDDTTAALMHITRKFLIESGAERAARSVHIDIELEKGLGIGSLEKAELLHRIENHFQLKLPETLLAEARTLRDVQQALSVSNPQKFSQDYRKIQHIHLARANVDLSSVSSLNEVLFLYAQQDPERPYLLMQEEDGEHIVTYGELWKRAQALARGLIQNKISPGDTVAIMLPSSCDFFYAFYGTLLAGAIPVPIYPPMRWDQIGEYAQQEAKILHNAGIKLLISFKRAKTIGKLLKPFVPSLLHVTDVATLLNNDNKAITVDVSSHDIAMLQYTSGSTGHPKGVVLTHSNLLANIRAYGKSIKPNPTDVAVSWLPLYHDMGLIGFVMGCLYHGIPLVLMSPLMFLSRPEKWLWMIHYRRGTLSAAPNFAYELCIKKIKDHDIQGLDLSSWRLAFNGAEAINPKTLSRFSQRFSRYGFKEESWYPVYGLAESAVALTFPPLGRKPLVDRISRYAFETEKKAIPSRAGENFLEFVACGSALPLHEIRVVDDQQQLLAERCVGNLQFRGPSAMQGYYRNAAATQAIYHQGWWSSGDLAYVTNNEVYLTGRKKDLIIRAGRNYYPPEIEEVVNDIEGVRKGCVAAFGIFDNILGTERLIIVAEKNLRVEQHDDLLVEQIQQKIMQHITIPADEVVLVAPRTIPKTSSGKLRRSTCKAWYLEDRLNRAVEASWKQLARVYLKGWGKKIVKFTINIFKALYTIYLLIIAIIAFIPIGLLALVASRGGANRLAKFWCWCVIRASLCPVKIVGKKSVNLSQARVIVANHASYIDAVLLMAILPKATRFVAKKELGKIFFIRYLLEKVGCIFVDRFNVAQSTADFAEISRHIESGHSVAFFPEGTFVYATGVRPFKSGPFKLAAQYGIPVSPVAIQNTRRVWRANRVLLAPHGIRVTLLDEKIPESLAWRDMVSVRDWARKAISKYCGEEMIDLIAAGPDVN